MKLSQIQVMFFYEKFVDNIFRKIQGDIQTSVHFILMRQLLKVTLMKH